MLQINSFDLYQILIYAFAWTTLYFVLCLCNSRRSYEWHCRMVTVVHATLISSLAIYITFLHGPWPFTDAGGPNTPLQVRTVSLCLAYFLFDFSWCMYFKTEGPVMVAHHFLSIVGLTWCLMAGRYGTELVATIGGAEITNPLLQLRWFLRETGYYRGTIWGHLVDWAFMLSFGFIRIVLGSMLLYSYYQQNTDFWGRLGGTAIYSIGWIFFIGILNYAIRKYVRIYKNWVKATSPGDKSSEDDSSTNRNVKEEGIGVIPEREIPSQREIKNGVAPLTPRESLVVRDCPGEN
ncbi:transmembrane protein 136 [Plakobranchus ocellatus]|uniref:Transmembrane protein 136 n=1 Tax=Plakobranchus ocellatus TaxID=259542 RepID=A0AAV3ZVL7_9GAST|nr:transmembrane protein 136 [Plakobranchus ocellatus]